MAASPTEKLSREEPNLVLLEGIVGSTAYGLAHEDSDIDRLGIFIEPTTNPLGFDGVSGSDLARVRRRPSDVV